MTSTGPKLGSVDLVASKSSTDSDATVFSHFQQLEKATPLLDYQRLSSEISSHFGHLPFSTHPCPSQNSLFAPILYNNLMLQSNSLFESATTELTQITSPLAPAPFLPSLVNYLQKRKRRCSNAAVGECSSRRQRTTFSSEQTLRLEIEYDAAEYVCRAKRCELAKTLGLTEQQVKIWYQNRRAKDKRIEKAQIDQQLRACGFDPFLNQLANDVTKERTTDRKEK